MNGINTTVPTADMIDITDTTDITAFKAELRDLLIKYDVGLCGDFDGDTYGIDSEKFVVTDRTGNTIEVLNEFSTTLDAGDLKPAKPEEPAKYSKKDLKLKVRIIDTPWKDVVGFLKGDFATDNLWSVVVKTRQGEVTLALAEDEFEIIR